MESPEGKGAEDGRTDPDSEKRYGADREKYEDELREKFGSDLRILGEACQDGPRPADPDPAAEEWAKLFAEAFGDARGEADPTPGSPGNPRLVDSLRGYLRGAEAGYADGFAAGKGAGLVKGARQGYVEGYGEAFDLVMEARDPGRAATVESRKEELERALGFRTDDLERGVRGRGWRRKGR